MLIRNKDFEASAAYQGGGPHTTPAGAAAAVPVAPSHAAEPQGTSGAGGALRGGPLAPNGTAAPVQARDNGRSAHIPSPLSELADRSSAIALAAEQAAADCSSYIELILARQREAERASPDGAPPGAVESLEADAGRAAGLRDRLNRLSDQRRDLVAALGDHTEAVGEHLRAAQEQTEQAGRCAERAAETRQELYGLIAALAALTSEARAESAAAEPAAADGSDADVRPG